MSVLLSIITPCYNHGKYLDEMIASVHNYEWPFDFEHIIINDGSTDELTNAKIESLKKRDNIKVINQRNEGLAKARNNGIVSSSGKYILPLDADNKIEPITIREGLELLEQDNNISVLYTDFEFFGERIGVKVVGDFNLEKILQCNYIDACSLIRKQSLLNAGGYDFNMPKMGHEDWDLWLNFRSLNYKFYYYPKVGYYYRLNSNSMSRTDSEQTYFLNKEYLFNKYVKQVSKAYDDLYSNKVATLDYLKRNKLKSVIKIIFNIDLF